MQRGVEFLIFLLQLKHALQSPQAAGNVLGVAAAAIAITAVVAADAVAVAVAR